MKKFITAIIIIVTVLAMPAVGAFAAEKPLEDIPMLNEYYCGSQKAYLYSSWDKYYILKYCSSEREEVLYKSDKEFDYSASISEDGKTVFFGINNIVYKYSYETNKSEKIYAVKVRNYPDKNNLTLYSSPNGEYCFIKWFYYPVERRVDSESYITLWHDGKEITEKADCPKVFGVSDSGEALVRLRGMGLYSFSFNSGKLEAAVELPDDKYYYDFLAYPDTGTYIMYSDHYRVLPVGSDDESDKYCKFYFGKTDGEQHSLFQDEMPKSYYLGASSKSIAVYDGEYVVRINLESGKRKRIVKLAEKRLNSNYIVFSEDFDAVLYINYSKNKLVRLSGWNDKKNGYTKREEIELNGTKKECIKNYSDDLKTVLLSSAEYDEDSKSYKNCAAFFESGKLVTIDTSYQEMRIDRFNNLIGIERVFYEKFNIDVITPDGSKKTAFSECDDYYRDWKISFFIFRTETATDAGEYYEYGVCTDYYINKNGEAVLLWDGRNTYEIEYLD
ncbi:MAG: hypothetical protein K2J11_01455 [Oscillospiraceae bacterium]|nr:hypothetical protein [Oscillospiraceae bacterium]